jgi:hypothetical protein
MLATRTVPKAAARILALATLAALAGCRSKQVVITSDPPGAVVTMNDVEVGRTPTTASFVHYGEYDVLLTLEGYEPLRTSAKASAPIYDWPPLDLATAAVPGETTIRWHFKLEPALESAVPKAQLEADLLTRARELRAQVSAPNK